MKKSMSTGLVATTLLIGAVSQALPSQVDHAKVPAGCKNLAIKQAELMDKVFNSYATPADNDGNPAKLTLGMDPAYNVGTIIQTYEADDRPTYPEEIYEIEVDAKGPAVQSTHIVELTYGSRSGCSITGIKK